MFLPKFKIYYKPLVPKGALDKFDPKKVLKSLQREILEEIRAKIEESAFSPRAKRALKKALSTKIAESSITVTAHHPAFFPLLEGKSRQQMTWLTKAKKPIPIITDTGELIFRSATPRSMARGRWYHPQRESTHILDKAKDAARTVIKNRLGKQLRKQLQTSLARIK